MQVILAGYNLDHEIIARLAEKTAGEEFDAEALTPETLSAAYARISRDPDPIPKLRASALRDVAQARKSNRQIVFGFGHASVAEHAVFNIDVLGISRLAMEALEATRIGSYTEKSQRYILLDEDYIIPAEITGTEQEEDLRALLKRQQAGYQHAYDVLTAHYARTQPGAWANRKSRQLLEGAAKEDARYYLGLTTTGQVGVTLNARSLEATVRRLAADPLDENRRLGSALHAVVKDIAPSLVRYTEATDYRRETPAALEHLLNERMDPQGSGNQATVILADAPADGDALLLAALIHAHRGCSWSAARATVEGMSLPQREALICESLRRLDGHESPLRQFELPALTFELTLSASCFAQLKRHRLATLLPQPYAPALGVTIPAAFAQAGLQENFLEVTAQAEACFEGLSQVHAPAAAYALTNAHRRRVLFKANARELYHLARLRLDEHAQWDIRALAEEMIALAKAALPLTMRLATGKRARLSS